MAPPTRRRAKQLESLPIRFNTCARCGCDNISLERASACSMCGTKLSPSRFTHDGFGPPEPWAAFRSLESQ